MMVARMQVCWLTWVTVRPARRRAAARSSPMLTPRLHRWITLRAAPGTDTATYHSIIAHCDRRATARGGCQAGPGPILHAVDRLVGGTTKGGTVSTEDRMAHPSQDVTRSSNHKLRRRGARKGGMSCRTTAFRP